MSMYASQDVKDGVLFLYFMNHLGILPLTNPISTAPSDAVFLVLQ
jgi:hypothetical protein